MRPLRLLLLIAILPGLLLPGGFVWRLCQCAAMGAPAACCVVEPRACCCQASGTLDDGSAEPTAESRPECTCGVVATPEKEPANEVLGTGVLRVMAPAQEPAFVMAQVSISVHGARVIALAKPPPDATRNLPLLI